MAAILRKIFVFFGGLGFSPPGFVPVVVSGFELRLDINHDSGATADSGVEGVEQREPNHESGAAGRSDSGVEGVEQREPKRDPRLAGSGGGSSSRVVRGQTEEERQQSFFSSRGGDAGAPPPVDLLSETAAAAERRSSFSSRGGLTEDAPVDDMPAFLQRHEPGAAADSGVEEQRDSGVEVRPKREDSGVEVLPKRDSGVEVLRDPLGSGGPEHRVVRTQTMEEERQQSSDHQKQPFSSRGDLTAAVDVLQQRPNFSAFLQRQVALLGGYARTDTSPHSTGYDLGLVTTDSGHETSDDGFVRRFRATERQPRENRKIPRPQRAFQQTRAPARLRTVERPPLEILPGRRGEQPDRPPSFLEESTKNIPDGDIFYDVEGITEAHNLARAKHGAPPLCWDPCLASAAYDGVRKMRESDPRPGRAQDSDRNRSSRAGKDALLEMEDSSLHNIRPLSGRWTMDRYGRHCGGSKLCAGVGAFIGQNVAADFEKVGDVMAAWYNDAEAEYAQKGRE